MGEEQTARTRDFEHFITFIDAIVAIAITLLVLPLVDVAGQLHGGSVAHLLRAHSAEIWTFLLSFAVIARPWFAAPRDPERHHPRPARHRADDAGS